MLLAIAAVVAATCQTPAIVATLRAQPGAGLARPSADEVVDRAHVRVHHSSLDGVADVAEAVADAMENAYVRQVETLAMPAPLADDDRGGDDRLDVYLDALLDDAAGGTVPEGVVNATGAESAAFIIINPFALPDDQLVITCEHELHHALQFAVDAGESVMFLEGSAVLQELRVAPNEVLWQTSLPDFQGAPQYSVYTDSGRIRTATLEGLAPRYEYGSALWFDFVDRRYGRGDGTLPMTWLRASADVDTDEVNEPDWLDAMASQPVIIAEAVQGFSTWRVFIGGFAVNNTGLSQPSLSVAQVSSELFVIENLRNEPITVVPHALGCVYRYVLAPAAGTLRVRAQAGTDDQNITVTAAIVTSTTGEERVLGNGVGIDTELDIPAGADAIYLAACDVSAADSDDELAARPMTLRLSRPDQVDPVIVDAGPEPIVDGGVIEGPPPAEDCNCQQSSPQGPSSTSTSRRRGPIGAFLFFAGVVMFGVRASRFIKQRRLYRADEQRRSKP